MRLKKRFLFILIIGIILIFLILKNSTKHEENVLRIAITSFPETLDAMIRSEYFTNLVTDQLYSKLFDTNSEDESFEQIGKSWTNVSDSLVVIYLNNNNYFHNGDEITAYDVKASIERFINNPKSISRGLVQVDSIEIVDKYSLKIYHDKEFPPFRILFNIPIYSKKQISSFSESFINLNPVGSGNYYLYSGNNDIIVLKKNPYKKGIEKLFNEIKLYRIPSKDEQVNKMLNNEIDFIINPPFERFSVLNTNSNISIISKTSAVTLYMPLDIHSPNLKENKNGKNPLQDVRVRKAIWHCFDTQSFINDKLVGMADHLAFPWPKYVSDANSQISLPDYNISLSNKLLSETPWKEGFNLKIYCIENKFNGDIELGEFIRKSLKQINITANIYYFPSEKFYEAVENDKVSCFVTGYSTTSKVADGPLYSLFYYSDIARGNMNRLNINIPQLNELINQSRKMSDNDFRKNEVLNKASQLIYDGVYIIPFYSPTDNYAIHKKILWKKTKNDLRLNDLQKK